MGLSIHYRGRLKTPDLISSITDELTDICRSLGWETSCLDEDFSRENTSRLVHTEKGAEITGHLPLKGVGIAPGKGCEGVSFFFDRYPCITSANCASSYPAIDSAAVCGSHAIAPAECYNLNILNKFRGIHLPVGAIKVCC